ncbi:MAG: hypothetical protein MPK62_00965 [Alphaproteobacteria bacterium]|nr:hypothetical protein [Alphaproteobacteria bacterium]
MTYYWGDCEYLCDACGLDFISHDPVPVCTICGEVGDVSYFTSAARNAPDGGVRVGQAGKGK